MSWLLYPETMLLALPGYVIFVGWVCRALDLGSRRAHLVLWVASMIWHLVLVTMGPMVAMLLLDHFPVYLYGAVVLPPSVAGFVMDSRGRTGGQGGSGA